MSSSAPNPSAKLVADRTNGASSVVRKNTSLRSLPWQAGRDRLFVLAFDHRSSLRRWMREAGLPLREQDVAVAKELVVEGLARARSALGPGDHAAVLLDEEYGSRALEAAQARGLWSVIAVERSGMSEFDFENGADFMTRLEALRPAAAKALVRYNPTGDQVANERSRRRLGVLSEHLGDTGPALVLELLVPPTRRQLAEAGSQAAYDTQIRPELTVQAMRELSDAGVRPLWWKLEGLADSAQAAIVGAVGQETAPRGCLVLGRGADTDRVQCWLEIAAHTAGFGGFAVGRTLWIEAVHSFLAGRATPEATADAVAARYLGMVQAYTTGKKEQCE